jgi:hypothetical protein
MFITECVVHVAFAQHDNLGQDHNSPFSPIKQNTEVFKNFGCQ